MTQIKTIPQQQEERKELEFKMAIEKRFKAIKYDVKIIQERKDNSEFKDAIHWQLTFNDKFKIEYSEGIGHFINHSYYLRNKVMAEKVINKIKSGAKLDIFDFTGWTSKDKTLLTKRVLKEGKYQITAPDIKDVFYSLTMDADAINYNFEDWAENYGYDTDSRKALDTWHACTNNYRTLRALDFTLEELQTYFEGY